MKRIGKFVMIAAMAMASYSASAELEPQWSKGTMMVNAAIGVQPFGGTVSLDYVLVDVSRCASRSFMVFRFESFSYGQFFVCGGKSHSHAYASTSFSFTRHNGRITVIGNFSICITGAIALNAPWNVMFISMVSMKSSMLCPNAILFQFLYFLLQ